MTVTAETDILLENSTRVFLNLTNLGDEPAYNVQVTLLLDYFQSELVSIEKLDINKSYSKNITLYLEDNVKPGKYIIPILVEYADVNDYPFSSISSVPLIFNMSTASKITISMNELTLSMKDKKRLNLDVKNLDDVNHDIKIKLFLPNEIKSDVKIKDISIKGREEETVYFNVENLAALEGSSYNILTTAEYEDEIYHYSSFSHGRIEIKDIEEETEEEFPLLTMLLVFSLILILIYIYFKVKK